MAKRHSNSVVINQS